MGPRVVRRDLERAVTTEAARLVAEVLARRLGVGAESIPPRLTDTPVGAAMALSFLDSAPPAARVDAAEIVQLVARMTGACPVCLGLDAACGDCQGRRGPGARVPDADVLVKWIAPALDRVGLCVGRPKPRPPTDTQGGGPTR